MNDFLMHYGIKGQKWGIRRYQNPDGTLTPEGRIHYKSESYKRGFIDSNDRITKKGARKLSRLGNYIQVDYLTNGISRINNRRTLEQISKEAEQFLIDKKVDDKDLEYFRSVVEDDKSRKTASAILATTLTLYALSNIGMKTLTEQMEIDSRMRRRTEEALNNYTHDNYYGEYGSYKELDE